MRQVKFKENFNIAVGDAGTNTAMLDAAVPFIAVRNHNKQFDYATNIYNHVKMNTRDDFKSI